MQSALSALLTSVAGHYAHLSPSDVGIGITGGRLVVSDVQLRPESLESPALPFRIISGKAGILRVRVPWGALSSSPVSVQLENVTLVAEPRSSSHERHDTSFLMPPELAESQKWHQTRIGRLLFNTQTEIVNLTVEYRDIDCIARVEAASLNAYSVNENWEPEFVQLDCNEGTVVMRKIFVIEGLQLTMAPESNLPGTASEECFEYDKPMLEGVNVSVKALVCAGDVSDGGEKNGGIHVEFEFELDEPAINFSKRQGDWIQQIFKDAAGISSENLHGNERGQHTRDRNQFNNKLKISNEMELDKSLMVDKKSQIRNGFMQSTTNEDIMKSNQIQDSSVSIIKLCEDVENSNNEIDSITDRVEKFSFWNAIVEENSDETIDDAAFALGLNSVMGNNDNKINKEGSDSSEKQKVKEQYEESTRKGDNYARRAVQLATSSGGMTFRILLKMQERGKEYKSDQFGNNLKRNGRFENELKYHKDALMNAIKRAEKAENEAHILKKKNENLLLELQELEMLTSAAVRNKDSIIREIEKELSEAEKHLQIMKSEKEEDRPLESMMSTTNRVYSTDTMIINQGYEEEDQNVDEKNRNTAVQEESLDLNSSAENVVNPTEIIFNENNEDENLTIQCNENNDLELHTVEFGAPESIHGRYYSKEQNTNQLTTDRTLTNVELGEQSAINESYEEEGLTLI